MTYKNPTPVVVALLKCGEGLLVLERSIEPKKGMFAFPGGYVDEGESAEVAISREVLEETGYDIEQQFWFPTITEITPDNKLLIFMTCDIELTEAQLVLFEPNNESASVRIAYPGEELAFPLHTKALNARAIWE